MRSLMIGSALLALVATGCSGVQTEPTTSSGDVTITEVIPAEGPLAGNVPVQIKGSGFTDDNLLVTFGGSAVDDAEVVNSTTIRGTLPPYSQPALVDVVVACANGQATLQDGFEYREGSAISITGLTPNSGPLTGGTTVTVTGAGFQGGATIVRFGQTNGTGVTVVSDSQLTVLTPAAAANGPVAVSVSNDNGTAQLPNAFVYGTAGGGGGGNQTTSESLGGTAELNRMLVNGDPAYSSGFAMFFAQSDVLYPANNTCALNLDQIPSVSSFMDAGNTVTLTQSATSLQLAKNTSTPNRPYYVQNNGPANGFTLGQMAGISAPGASTGIAAFNQASVAQAPASDYDANINLFFSFSGGGPGFLTHNRDLWLDWASSSWSANHVQVFVVGAGFDGATHVLHCDIRGADAGGFCVKGGASDDLCQTPGATMDDFWNAIGGPQMGFGMADIYLYRGNRANFTLPGGASAALDVNVVRVTSALLQ